MYQLRPRGLSGPFTLLTPAEAERAVQETTDAWNVLRNELYGRGVVPRQDVPLEFQTRVLREYAAYRAFVGRLTAFDSVTNNFSGELSQWRRIYDGLRSKWASMSVTSMAPELQETQGPGEAAASIFSSIAAAFAGLTWPVLLTAGGVGIAVLGWTAFLARPVRAQAKYAPRHRRAT
jgi:hypothetical protein